MSEIAADLGLGSKYPSPGAREVVVILPPHEDEADRHGYHGYRASETAGSGCCETQPGSTPSRSIIAAWMAPWMLVIGAFCGLMVFRFWKQRGSSLQWLFFTTSSVVFAIAVFFSALATGILLFLGLAGVEKRRHVGTLLWVLVLLANSLNAVGFTCFGVFLFISTVA